MYTEILLLLLESYVGIFCPLRPAPAKIKPAAHELEKSCSLLPRTRPTGLLLPATHTRPADHPNPRPPHTFSILNPHLSLNYQKLITRVCLFAIKSWEICRVVASGEASGARPPYLKSVLRHLTFGPAVAAYFQCCILKLCLSFWFLPSPCSYILATGLKICINF